MYLNQRRNLLASCSDNKMVSTTNEVLGLDDNYILVLTGFKKASSVVIWKSAASL